MIEIKEPEHSTITLGENRLGLAYLNSFFPSLTGTFINREIFELQRRGIALQIYALRRPDQAKVSKVDLALFDGTYYLLPVNFLELVASHGKFMLKDPIRYFRCLYKMLTGTHKKTRDRFRSLMHFGEGVVLANAMLRKGVRHIHAQYASQTTSVARVVYLLTNIPYSFTAHAHDIWHDQILLPEKLREAKFVVTCTDFGRRFLVNLPPNEQGIGNKIFLVYHGLDVRKFKPPANPLGRDQDVILSIGRLTEQKGFPYLIEAVSILRGKGYPIKCLIIGEGEDRLDLEDLIKSLHLENEVKLLGALPQERILQYLHTANLFILPCVDTKEGNRDGIPNVLMEAMATGLPVITTTNSGQGELISDQVHGLLIPQKDSIAIAEAVLRLTSDDKLRDRLSKKARERMESEFDNQKTIEPLIQILQEYTCSFHAARATSLDE